ncbi:MAG: hypothetical protein HS104_11565 [Polyangiaceae bacterium]|nr:hypothetical protein [Polyangiaceae bacterium]MCL4748584.1 hypothetical protein [Myxococcales bacterium]
MDEPTATEILEHLPYALTHIDGAIWACEFIAANPRTSMKIKVGGTPVAEHAGFFPLTNALAETGLVCNRKVVEFLGIKLRRNEDVLYAVDGDRSGDDAGIEQIGGTRLNVEEYLTFGQGAPDVVRAACVHALRSASKGVAHFTNTPNFKAHMKPTVLCLTTTLEAVEECAYRRTGREVPDYRVWSRWPTEPRAREQASTCPWPWTHVRKFLKRQGFNPARPLGSCSWRGTR